MSQPAGYALSKEQYEEIARGNANDLRKWASRINSNWKAKVLRDLIDPISVRSILEFGCGHAEVSKMLTNGWEIDSYVGVDLSSEQLAHAHVQWPEGHFITGDEKSLSGLGKKFDLALFLMPIRKVHTNSKRMIS